MTISKQTQGWGIAKWLLLVALVATTTGCQAIATIAYLTVPNDVPAEYKDLKDMRVVVVCDDVGGLGYQDAAVPSDLARAVGINLRRNVKRIDVVRQDDVNNWIDNGDDVREIELGRSLDADKVVSIHLEQFRLNKGPNLYQGHAQIMIRVFDVESGDVEAELSPLETLYPPHSAVPLEESEVNFRRNFVRVLAKQVGRRFYAHESLEASRDRLYPSD